MSFKSRLRGAVNRGLGVFGWQLSRSEPFRHAYIDAATTIRAASKASLSVSAYVKQMWGSDAQVREVGEFMAAAGPLTPHTRRVCEIGAGTGVYLEEVLKRITPDHVEVYEPNHGWASYLRERFGVVTQPCDGEHLGSTPDDSSDLVAAHGVFVYTPFLISMSYIAEAGRVLREGKSLVFDVACDHCFGGADIAWWLASPQRYPAFLSCTMAAAQAARHGLEQVEERVCGNGPGRTHYLAFRRLARP
jgi:SAM-dependent methyltransferase